MPRRFAALRRLFLVALTALGAGSAAAQVTRNAVTADGVSGGAFIDTANNHVRTAPTASGRDVVRFDTVAFGSGYDTVELLLRLAHGSGAQRIDLRIDAADGPVVGTLFAESTGNQGTDYVAQTARLDPSVTGARTLYLTIDDTTGLDPIRLRSVTLKNRGPLSAFLKQNGVHIRNHHGEGDIVRLYGVNLGGWALQEPWMSPLAFGDSTPGSRRDQKGALDILNTRFGAASARAVLDTFHDAYITAADFDRIRAENLNCIRLPIYWQDYMDDSGEFRIHDGRIDFRRIEAVVTEASKRGLYVVIDLHGAPGSQNARDHSGDIIAGGVASLWTSAENKRRTKNLWREIARRFRSEPAVAGYDLLNEAAKTSDLKSWDSEIRAFFTELYDTIREVDPDHIIFFDVWSEYYDVGNLTSGKTNIVLSYHWYIYDSFPGTEANFWNQRIGTFATSSREAYPFPVLIGEFSFKDSDALWGDRMKLMTRHGLSWTKWSYKVRGGGGWGMYEANGYNETNRLYVDSAGLNTLLDKADNWDTATTFTQNTAVTDSLKNAVALFGEPARPSAGGPLSGLTKELPHTRHGGVTQGNTGWATFAPGGHVVLLDPVDFGPHTDRFFAHLHVDATLSAGEAGGVLEVRLDSSTGPLLGSVTLQATGVSSASLQRRPVGLQKIVLVARRPGSASATNIGLIKRVSFSEPPVVNLLNKSSLAFASVQPSDASLATTGSATEAGDREDFFLLTTAADPLASASFATALLSRKTLRWVGADATADHVLQARTLAYDDSPAAPTISAQRAAAPQFVVTTTADADYRSLFATANSRYIQTQSGDGPLKAKHASTVIGSYEKFEVVPRQLPPHPVPPHLVDLWRESRFTALELADASVSGDAADPDRDGLPNLLEFALGTNPRAATPASALSASLTPASPRALRLAFDRAASPFIRYEVEASSDLAAWTVIWTSAGAQNLSGPVTVTDPADLGAQPRRFLRLRVTRE